MPDIMFTNSPRTEEERLKMTEKVIRQGFYRRHGFIVTPTLIGQVDANSQVVYPGEYKYDSIKTQKWAKVWKVGEGKFWQELEWYLPSARKVWPTAEVRLTRYGTVASDAKRVIKAGGKATFYLRNDADISNLAAIMINSLLELEKNSLGITWSKREALMDFIMTRPAMRALFPKFRPVLSGLSRVPSKFRKASEKYLISLGLESQAQDLAVVGGRIMVRNKQVEQELTKKEKVTLKLLLRREGELVTYDELADTLWGEGEFKTYWAINKLILRLRSKLRELGLEKVITPVRGQGYILQ